MEVRSNEVFYTYSDVTIMPSVISDIEHRSECNPLDSNGMLPLFTAPMDTVVSEANFEKFTDEMIYAILPRTVDIDKRVEFSINSRWAAYSLKEFEKVFCNARSKVGDDKKIFALIDVANGHMKKIIDLVRASRNIYGDNIVLMVGNIANPETYRVYADVGVDYVRVGIGNGLGCITQSNVAVGCAMATLVHKTAEIKRFLSTMKSKVCSESGCKFKRKYQKLPKIVADGGIRNYSDIIKALALGADYVMCGSMFSKMVESAAEKKCDGHEFMSLPITLNDIKDIRRKDGHWYGRYNKVDYVDLGNITAVFYGMASKEGQIALNGRKEKTSEGISKVLNVEYTMHGWCENFMDYLRSAMSYVGSRTLDEFKSMSKLVVNSTNAVSVVNK